MMEYPVRKELRLRQYDYSLPGAYFVTLCVQDRRCILSEIRRGDPCGRPRLVLSRYGRIVEDCLRRTEDLYGVCVEKSVIMPNHMHFLVSLESARATARVAPTLGRVVGAFKSMAANDCRRAGLTGKLWQRGYYEHVIRGEADYRETWEYMDNNPDRWAEDEYYRG